MDEEKPFFTEKEISIIDKSLGFIVFDWAKHLINHILSQARQQGVKVVYMNTNETLDSGANEGKVEYFYDRLPKQLGFSLEKANLRGKGNETLWAYHFDSAKSSRHITNFLKIAQANIAFESIPTKYQGAFISMVGRKPSYTQEEVKYVIGILDKKQKPKSLSKFYYDWHSKEWSGAQRFNANITENVIMQKIPKDLQSMILENPTLLKFWSYVLSQSGHFGNDVIGFALLSKISKEVWVINEIQTDCIQTYMKIRSQYYKKDKIDGDQKMSWETLKDMLEAQNRSNWISVLETNEALKQQIINNPNIIQQLPDNTQNIQKWMADRQRELADAGANQGLDLIRHFQFVNFNSRIFRIY